MDRQELLKRLKGHEWTDVSDLMKAMFGKSEGEKQPVTPPVASPVAPAVTRRKVQPSTGE